MRRARIPRFAVLALLLAAGAGLGPWAGGAEAAGVAGAEGCDAPPSYAPDTSPLPHVAAALRAGKLAVLAIGSGTTVGPETGRNDGAFPFRMADALRAAHPGLVVELTVLGGRGLLARDMLDMVREQVARAPVQLIVWQTGTVEAVQSISPSEFAGTLSDGAALAEASGADLVLVDPQFSRFLRANADLSPYEAVLGQVAAQPGVALFQRFTLMQGWAEQGRIDLERATRGRRQDAAALLHACLGEQLARLVMSDAAAPP